jgi:hypothetical protein
MTNSTALSHARFCAHLRAFRNLRHFIAIAGVLLVRPAHADEVTDFLSPGILGSFDISHRWAFGLGTEISYSHYVVRSFPSAVGAFFNAVHYFAPVRGRFALGVQENLTALGGEAGWSLVTGSNADYGLHVATGPIVGAFASAGYVMVALRGSFAAFGDVKAGSFSLDFAAKLPLAFGSDGVDTFDL